MKDKSINSYNLVKCLTMTALSKVTFRKTECFKLPCEDEEILYTTFPFWRVTIHISIFKAPKSPAVKKPA